MTTLGTYNFYLHGYIGDLRYSLEFIVDQTRDNKIRASIMRGRLNICIQATPPVRLALDNGTMHGQ